MSNSHPANNLHVCLFLTVTTIALLTPSTKAQTAPAPTAIHDLKTTPAFDVVSIRTSKDTRIQMFGTLADEYRARNVPLGITVAQAYFPMAQASRERIQGAPSWVWNENYDFEGKVNPADMPEWDRQRSHFNGVLQNRMLQAMLQAALADRCKLLVHHIPTMVPGYALVVGKHGPNWKNLKETVPGETIPSIAQEIAEGGALVPIMPGAEQPIVGYFHTSMASLAGKMSAIMVIEDRTGLKGKYDFSLLRLQDERDPAIMWDWSSLDLKLIPIKVPSEILVIDHIEKPTPN